MKTTRKLLLALVLVMSILMTLAVAVIPASAVNANYKVIYMKPGVWNTDGAWYAVWSYSTSSNGQWAKFTDYDGDGVYSAYIPVGHTKMNLVRMNSSATTPNWNQKWNQTSDITINSNNYFTITGWNQSNYTSGTYTVASKNVCFPGAYNNWDSNTKATVSNGIATMTVKITNATTYAFKVLVGDKWYSNSGTINGSTADNGWEMSTSVSGDCNLKITETGYYSFEFHLGTGYLSVHKHTGGTATCTAKAECTICGESYGELADHSYTNYTSNGDATCTADGTKTGTCSCGAKDTVADVGSKLAHTYTNYTSNGDATCTSDGTKTGTCTCGATDTIADVGSKLAHTYTNYTSNGDATCTADGTKTGTCSCGAKDTVADVGSKLAHTYTNYTSNGDATCTADGTKTGTCTCGATNTIADVGSKLDHTYTNYTSNGDATCTADGTKTGTCSCGATNTIADVGSKLDHTYTNYTSNGDATCTADGTETGTCTCGAKHTRVDEDSKLDHTERTPATCTAQAVCDVCGNSYGELAAHEYLYNCDAHCKNCGELTNEEASHTPVHVEATAPICTENGNVEYWYCSDCGSAWLDVDCTIQTNLKAVVLGATCATNAVHNEGVEASCSNTGLIENWYCANCDVYYLDAACTIVTNYKNLTIPALEHDIVVDKAVDATCTATGLTEGKHCTKCDYKVAQEVVDIDANAHYDGCGHYAVEGDSLQAALNKSDVVLTKPVSITGALTIPSGKTLDLNGQTLTADGAVIFGIVKGSGTLTITKGKLFVSKNAENIVPVKVAETETTETYIFRVAKTLTAQAPEGNDFFFRPTLSGYDVTNKDIFCGTVDNGLDLMIKVTRTPVGGSEKDAVSAYVTISDETISEVYSKTSTGFVVTLTNENANYTYSVEFAIVIGEVEVYSAPIAWVPKTEEENQ